jgi:hypothetical protein
MKMSSPPCFWSHLEKTGFIALKIDWQPFLAILGKGHKALFTPLSVATSIPCHDETCREECPAEIQEHRGAYRAICPQQVQPPKPLKREDVLEYRLNIEILHPLLAAGLGINHVSGKVAGAPSTYLIGRSPQLMGNPRNHYVCYATAKAKISASVNAIATEEKGAAFILLLPTAKHFSPDLNNVLAKAGGEALALSEMLPLVETGQFVKSANVVRDPEVEYTATAKFPTPANCTWQNITIEFKNNDEVEIRAPGGICERYSYADLGMKDTKKTGAKQYTLQWVLLSGLSKNQGEFPFRGNANVRRYQKQKQKLCKRLSNFFGSIPGDPIIAKNGIYTCQFKLKPHGNVARKSSLAYMDMEADSDIWGSSYDDSDED